MNSLSVQTLLDESSLTRDAIEKIIDEGIAQTVRYTSQHSPFYRDRFAKLGLSPDDCTCVADLQKLPLTTKEQVSQGESQFWATPREQLIDIVTTSGTTGAPTVYPLTGSDLNRLGDNELLSFRCVGLTEQDTVLLGVTIDKCFMAGLAYFEGLRKIGAATVRIGAGSPVMLLDMLQRVKPTAIVSVPSFLKRVSQYAAQQNIDLQSCSVDKIICIGEPVRNQDLSLTTLAEQLQSIWGAKLFSTYGITELAASACECQAGAGGHIHPQLLHVEIADEQGNPLPDGQIGEIVATTIGVQAMPLIRFATGDMASITHQQCPCGRRTPRLGPICGRRNQMLKIKGTTVYPAAVQHALEATSLIGDYVMIATSPSSLADELEIVATTPDESAQTHQAVCEHLQGRLKVTPKLRFVSHKQIEQLRDAKESRKKRTFIDKRKR